MGIAASREIGRESGGQPLGGAFMVETTERKLPQVVEALIPPGRFASGLNRGQEKRHEHANNGNDDQELHERKALATSVRAWTNLIVHGCTHEERPRCNPVVRLRQTGAEAI